LLQRLYGVDAYMYISNFTWIGNNV